MRLFPRAIRYFRQDAGKFVLLFALIALCTLLGLLWPFPLAILIDSVLGTRHFDRLPYRLITWVVPAGDKPRQILVLAGSMLVIRGTTEALRTAQTLLGIRLGLNALLRMRCELFRKFQELSVGYSRNQPQGDAIYRLSWDTCGIQAATNVLVVVLVNVLTLVFMAGIMFTLNWRLTLVALAVVPPLLWTIVVYGKVLDARSTEAKQRDSDMTVAIQRSISSMALVQLFGREGHESTRFDDTVRKTAGAWFRLHWHEVMYWLALGLIFAAGYCAMFAYGGYLAWRGSIELGMLVIFLDYLARLHEPLQKLSSSGSSLMTAIAGIRRVFEVFDRDPVIRDAPDAMHLPRQLRALALENVGFEYRPGEPVLDDLSVTIGPGEMVAFVGESGVGKSTLLSLLCRFEDPTRGTVALDGHDLRRVRVDDVRKHVAMVLQESLILPTTVLENIGYGRPDATDPQVRRAAELAGAAAFIEKLPRGYDTQVSESGGNLSGGERQRISIARALLTEAPILVFDEPTSALDPKHEQMVSETLCGLKGQRTIILVSHRLSTVADCDRIFVMEGGRIVEQGSHRQLLAQRGSYYRLARHQLRLVDAPAEASSSSSS